MIRIFRDKTLVYGKTPVRLFVAQYPNKRTALQLMCQIEDMDERYLEPYMTCTVNMVAHTCPPGEVWVKDYSENKGCLTWLVKHGVVVEKPTHSAQTGYVTVTRHALTAEAYQEIVRALAAEKKKGIV
jgi:hypothetical protein